MKIAILGDTHFGVKNGDRHFLEFQKYWFENQFFPELEKRDIKQVIQLGDWFDNRLHIKLNVLNEMLNWFPELVQKHDIQWLSLAGNHDLLYKNNNNVCSQDFLCHVLPDNFYVVKNTPLKTKFGVSIIPWINENNYEEIMSFVDKDDNPYICGHFEFANFPMYKGVLSEHGMSASLFSKYKKVFSGHYHTISDHTNVLYVGTPYHLTWADYPDGTNRGFFVFDTDTGVYELVKNEEHQTLFCVMEYDGSEKYDEEFFDPYVGSIMKIVVNTIEDDKHFKKFEKLLDKIDFIDYRVINNSIVKNDNVVITQEVLALDTLSSMHTYISSKYEDVDLVSGVKDLATKSYNKVNNV